MSADTTPTPEGWENRGEFLFRQYGGRFATLWIDEDRDWQSSVATLGESATEDTCETALADAVAWANDQLGVPKPVVVVEIECEDGVLLYSEDRKRWAVADTRQTHWFLDVDAAREYVRGVQ